MHDQDIYTAYWNPEQERDHAPIKIREDAACGFLPNGIQPHQLGERSSRKIR